MNSAIRKLRPAVVLLAAPLLFCADNGPKPTYEQIEQFLHTGKILKIKELSTGVTNSRRATLSDGTMQHDAHVQSIDESKARFEGDRGVEMNFRDTWKYNVAAYRLGRILELDMIPPSVERKVNGTDCAVTWWIDNSMMEVDRKKTLPCLGPVAQGKDGGDADNKDEEREDEIGRGAAVPFGVDQRLEPGAILSGTEVIDHDHGGDGQAPEEIQGDQALFGILVHYDTLALVTLSRAESGAAAGHNCHCPQVARAAIWA